MDESIKRVDESSVLGDDTQTNQIVRRSIGPQRAETRLFNLIWGTKTNVRDLLLLLLLLLLYYYFVAVAVVVAFSPFDVYKREWLLPKDSPTSSDMASQRSSGAGNTWAYKIGIEEKVTRETCTRVAGGITNVCGRSRSNLHTILLRDYPRTFMDICDVIFRNNLIIDASQQLEAGQRSPAKKSVCIQMSLDH